MKIGDVVIFQDELKRESNALVVSVWSAGGKDKKESLNLVFVNPDKSKYSEHGRALSIRCEIKHRDDHPHICGNWKEL